MADITRRHVLQALPAVAAAVPWLPQAARADQLRLRFATLVPRNSLYHRALLEVGEA